MKGVLLRVYASKEGFLMLKGGAFRVWRNRSEW